MFLRHYPLMPQLVYGRRVFDADTDLRSSRNFNALNLMFPELAATHVMDRAYLNFETLFKLRRTSAFFVALSGKSPVSFSPTGKSRGHH